MAENIKKLDELNEKANQIRQANRLYLISQKDKSDNDFEKNHIYISAGTLALSLTFIEKVSPITHSKAVYALVAAWILLVTSLLVNFISHQISSRFTEKQIDLNDRTDNTDEVNQMIDKNNKRIRQINWFSVLSLIGGICLLVVYCSANAIKMSHLQNENNSDRIEQPKGDDFTKGRTNVPLQRPSTSQPINTPQTPAPPPADTTKK